MSDAVRSVKRALDLIRLMNTRSVWALADLTLAMALPKTTVFRLLQTLEEEGLVRAQPGTHGLYRLSSSVHSLAAGVSYGSLLGEVSNSAVIAGTKRLRWPLSVAVLDDCYMRVVCCGMPYSKLAAKTTTLNRRYWMLTSALGMAYISFADPIEQQIILERAMAVLNDHGTEWPYAHAHLDQRMRAIREAGHSVRQAAGQDATSAIAIPINMQDELLGALVCSTYPKSLTDTRAKQLYPELMDVRSEIIGQWRRHGASAPATFDRAAEKVR
jgi:IclR family transcriptional regulator, mhp operon transcriptional activator